MQTIERTLQQERVTDAVIPFRNQIGERINEVVRAGIAAGTVGFGAARIIAPGAELPDWTAADMPPLVGRRAIVFWLECPLLSAG